MKKQSLFAALIAATLLFHACSGGKKSTDDKKQVTIAMVNWIECIANTNLAKAVLEEKGYEVKLVNADVAPVFAAVAKGNADLFLEVWEPITHKPYIEKFGDQVEHIGTIYSEGLLGLVVPQYVTINSIDELNSVKDQFEGKIIGINPGAGIMNITEDVIKNYELDYELVASSEAGMLASLKKAYDKQEWVVVTGWKPHTMFARYDLKILSDPKKTMGEAETISTIATKGWAAKNPELATFFKNFKMTDDLLGSLMLAVESNPGQEAEAAKQWYHEHRELVDSWFK
ncbi:glycine betaine ABC transporter substrate-binding protein [Mangrovibacterium marinum]|uniref:Glycine betaine/proline transport system substrate-binding protein n=1 Tax=Mangrovibacterium marinum TaxID=1639118 RepID=A0A2T5C373_9BACT|nr:glycine betaine ABC transporter substrate-binding protein [Mangrovibacterium marinum]PTN09237.1 glycine betaine/proline transport system substrate-binding protein [Mangrovibacterium marinum]